MNKREAKNLLPRFLNAVTSMALSPERSLRGRLAWVVNDVLVFTKDEIPNEIRERFDAFESIVSEPEVPQYAANHSNYPLRVRASYLSPSKAKQASELLVSMFETIAFAASFND